jgi:F-type H+-transporting ATPase subunit epsilon
MVQVSENVVTVLASSIHLDFITPEKTLFSGDASMVTVPGTLGDFGVLPGHAPFVSTIRPGIITIELPGKEEKKLAVLSGIAEVTPNRMTVLAESAVDCSGITGAQAEARLQAARARLEGAVSDTERKQAEEELALAQAVVASL